MDLLSHALAYAERGWPVFPVHTPQPDGSCSCRRQSCDKTGKHPRISQGRNGATTDPDTIGRWWAVWPDANIGIATGVESGLIVLDVDDGGEDTIHSSGYEIPDTVEQITGSGGRHVLFLRPDGGRYRTRVRFAPGLDSRADGGYIVAPPSLHASGRRYQWEGSSDPMDGVAVAPCPKWLIDAIAASSLDSLAPAPEWNPDGELPHNIIEMLSAIPADDYDIWRDVGMALHYTDPADGLHIWDWWSSTSDKYDGDAVRREWRNFSRRGHQVSNPITLCTVRRYAEQHGWVDPDIEHGAEVAANLLQSRQREIAEALKSRPTAPDEKPDNLMPSGGLIRDIAERIISTSVRPQPELAIIAATTWVGALAGRKYQTETGLRTNLYTIGLAESGAGKDHARKEIGKLAWQSDTSHTIGGERIASGPGVVSALKRHPSQLFMLDEFGLMLQAMTGKRADPHKRDLMAALMTLYSSAGGVYRGTEYADQRDRPRMDIPNPNACIYGTSTPAQFYSALTSHQGVDGTISRLIVVSAENHRPPRQRPNLAPPHEALIQSIRKLDSYTPGSGNMRQYGGAATDMRAQVVAMDDAVYAAWEQLDDDMGEHMADGPSRSIYSRVAENAAKLALVYAVSIDHQSPRIDAEAFRWGREIALWAANTMMRQIARYVADNEQEASVKLVMNTIADAGEGGITRSDLLRKVQTLRKRDIEEIVATLCEADQVAIVNKRAASGKGRPSTVYTAIDS